MYKTELHCHTRDASPCSNMSAEETVERYLAYGYTTLVITNHFCPFATMDDPEEWKKHVAKTYTAYDNLVRASGGRLIVLLGMEARFVQNGNDYLVYGGFDREMLETLGSEIPKMGIREFANRIHERGGIISHAHPFRYNQVVSQDGFVDGIEVFNGHFKHDSHNAIAEAWAEQYDLIKTSGTDHHDNDHYPDGGIETDEPITSLEGLVQTLKSRKYSLIRSYPFGKPQYDKYGSFLGLKQD